VLDVVVDVEVDVEELVEDDVDELVEDDVDELVDDDVDVDELVDEDVDELVDDEVEELVDDDVEELVDEDVEELVELDVLLDVLELVDVLVVVVTTSVPSCFSERNGSSIVASWRRPSFRLSSGPDWSPAITSATALNTPGLTLSVHICVPPIAVAGVPAGRFRFVVITIGFAKSGVPLAAGQ
jgi:hypothetical protein